MTEGLDKQSQGVPTDPGHGWWLANDGLYYPPERHPDFVAPPPPPPPPPADGPPAPDWWKASDGQWYPPASIPAATPPVFPPPESRPAQFPPTSPPPRFPTNPSSLVQGGTLGGPPVAAPRLPTNPSSLNANKNLGKSFWDYPWWLFAIGALCCWPIGVPVGVARVWKSEIDRPWKIAITVGVVAIVVIYLFSLLWSNSNGDGSALGSTR